MRAHRHDLCAPDGILPTRFRIEMEQALFDDKTTDYRRRTGTDVQDLERELAEVARRHMLGKGSAYTTYADTVTVKVEPHVMISGVRIVADFPAEKKIATVLSSESTARAETTEDVKLETVAKPVAANFDARSLETVVVNADRPSGGLETRVVSSDGQVVESEPAEKPSTPPSADAGMETRVVEPEKPEQPESKSPPAATGMETRVVTPDDTPAEDETKPPPAVTGMETRVYDPGMEENSPPAEAETPPERVKDTPSPADAGMETRVYEPGETAPSEPEPLPSSEMETVVEGTPRHAVRYVLVLLEPDENGDYQESETWMLESGSAYRIGRSRKNDVVVGVGTVSRHHALLRLDADGSAYLSDAGSSHGTFVEGQQVEDEVPIRVGDDIQLTQQGAAHLTLQSMGT